MNLLFLDGAIKNMLKKEQVLSIPELARTKSLGEIAKEFGCSLRAINYQVAKLRLLGVELSIKRGRRPLKLI